MAILPISGRDHGSGPFPAMIMMPGFTPWATASLTTITHRHPSQNPRKSLFL
jgi:hypothetical protein